MGAENNTKHINIFDALNIEKGNAICYSGYRENQNPGEEIYPSYNDIREDLLILKENWKYIRLYDCSQHAFTVLEVIKKEKLDIKVMLGAYIAAELNNFNCPWGAVYSENELDFNKARNHAEIKRLINLANNYPDIIFSLSLGNEASVDWTDHFVPVDRIIEFAHIVKAQTSQPITFCENYVPWISKLSELVNVLDFISIHTYPVWEYKNIHNAMEYTLDNFLSVAEKYPNKPVIITEAGWATNSNGIGINPENVSEEYQKVYINDLMKWSNKEKVLTFIFEAFDEPWKGSAELLEPEKHWGLYTVDRKPKKIMKEF